jgi:hypothetical protein
VRGSFSWLARYEKHSTEIHGGFTERESEEHLLETSCCSELPCFEHLSIISTESDEGAEEFKTIDKVDRLKLDCLSIQALHARHVCRHLGLG